VPPGGTRPFGRPQRGLRPAVFVLLAAVGGATPGVAGTVEGRVVDPQERVVAGAVVSLGCGASTDEHRTDAGGSFRFDRPGGLAGCTIAASADGFTTAPPQPLGASPHVLVRLGPPALSETLTVRPREGDDGLSAYRSLASVSIGAAELRAVSEDTADLVRYARARAGLGRATAGQVYVDGLPSGTLPPSDAVDRILVDADPFSAEFADGSEGRIDIATSAPDRKLRLRLGGSGFGAGGGSSLDPGAEARSRSWNLGATGPVPLLPLTFSVHSTLSDGRQDVPVRAVAPASTEPVPSTASASSSSRSVRLALDYARGATTRASASFLASRGRQSNVGLSGTTLPETAMSLGSEARELRATFTTRSAGLVHRGGLVGSWSETSMAANSRAPGVSVPGAWAGGGADTAALDARGERWAAKYVVQSGPNRRYWSAGAAVSRTSDSEASVPNPAGRVLFETTAAWADAQSGRASGTWLGARGGGRTSDATTEVAPFVEADVLQSARVRMRGGLRADYQAGGGTLLSPRLAGAALWRGATLRWGGGVFVHDWTTGVLLQAVENDRAHLDRFLARGDLPPVPIDSRIAAGLTRPRDLVLRASVERRLGGWTPGIEYTWTRTTHALGSRRLADGDGWVDTLESNRSARRERVHVGVQGEVKGQKLGAHYQWTRARDDGAGPFSFPETQDDLAAEWARTAGLAAHELTVVASLSLPAGVSLTVIDSWHSSTPFDVTSAADSLGLGLFNSRGSRPRNSGDGPGYHSTSLFGSRRVALPGTRRSGRGTYANVSLHVENLMNERNVVVVGSVAGSPLFGVPLVALPGRSVRVSVSFDR
jgi:hypothetical protein